MGNEKKYIIDGYRFDKERDFLLAQKELNRVTELKQNYDLKEETTLRELYDNLIESKEFRTPIGVGFLREVQKRLLQNPEQKKTMKAIPVKIFSFKEEEEAKAKLGASDYEILYMRGMIKLRNLRIIVFFCFLTVAVLFSVTLFDRSLTPERAKEAVLNEYAGWKEELAEKENELRAREKALEEREEKEKTKEFQKPLTETDGE